MTRIFAGSVLAAALAAAPLALTASPADAGAKGIKICKHRTASGQIKTWRCRVDQPCCSAEMINYYTCGSKLLGCL